MKFAIAFTLAALSAAVELRGYEDNMFAESGALPSNNEELSAFLGKYARNGTPKGIRYMGRQVWMSENCVDDDEGAFSAGFAAGVADDVDSANHYASAEWNRRGKYEYEVGFTVGLFS